MMKIYRLLVFANLACLVLAAQTQKQENFTKWLCRVLRLDPKLYHNMVGVRRNAEQFMGDKVAMADLQASTEAVVYDCGGCWSPAALDGSRILVLKSDGVWIAGAAAEPKLAVPADNLRMIAGPTGADRSSFLVLQREQNQAECKFRLKIADIVHGALRNPDEEYCLDDSELGALPRTQSVLGTRFLCAAEPGTGTRKVLVSDAACSDPKADSISSLLRWLDESGDGIDRFDSVWVDSNRVVYLQKL
jgi:hypothetical protein